MFTGVVKLAQIDDYISPSQALSKAVPVFENIQPPPPASTD